MKHKNLLFEQMKYGKDKILWILEKYPTTRDNDGQLYSFYVALELGGGNLEAGVYQLKNQTAYEFLQGVSKNKFMNYASLIRQRRLIQSNPMYSHLEGTKREERSVSDQYFRDNIERKDGNHI